MILSVTWFKFDYLDGEGSSDGVKTGIFVTMGAGPLGRPVVATGTS
jgi:hypothetical protein